MCEQGIYAVCILAGKRNGTLYIGVTNDLDDDGELLELPNE
jgi:predicted GIY-YIG superfamily endonuclease